MCALIYLPASAVMCGCDMIIHRLGDREIDCLKVMSGVIFDREKARIR